MTSDIDRIRNIAFVGHPSSGKTTLIDAMAFALGASDRKGSVGDKTSICDTEPEEQDRQHTLQQAVVHADKDGRSWNLVDTPGYPEFLADCLSAMFATELTVGVVSCASGVTFNLRTKLAEAEKLGRGRAIIVTHADGDNADFDALVEELRSSIGEVCVPILVPNESGSGFSSVTFDCGEDWKKRRCDRVMDACENEEIVMEYLETDVLSDKVLHEETPNAIAKGALIPILCCNPESGVGIDEVIQWLGEYAPSPITGDVFTTEGGGIHNDPDGPLTAVVFNVKSDPHLGKICSARILSGSLTSHDLVGEGKGEKLGGLFYPVGGKQRTAVESASAGDIVVFSKVEALSWGDSFSTAGQDPLKVEVPVLPTPMVARAVVPKTRSDEQKIGQALAKLSAEDPTFVVEHDPQTHELVVHGMSELHLAVVESRLKRRYGVEIETSLPRIAYKETITKPAEGHHRHKKQSGGRGQFGECYLRVRPGAEDSGVVFIDKVVGGAIPRNLIPAVEKGIRELAEEGILTHSRVVDVEVEVYDGKFHAVDSDEASFKKAGSWAFRDAFLKGAPVLLEPVMDVTIRVPADSAGTIFSDVTSHRRGTVVDQSSEQGGAVTVIKAQIPLAEMQTYQRDLKSQTAGEGSFSMELGRFMKVPAAEQQKVIAAFGKKASEED
ncbi:MAG TPA: elongation factor G [Planctomycetes bacterium]|nr:elongation factor G [Planctomycetota bacterium]